jgi:hypothetical protein
MPRGILHNLSKIDQLWNFFPAVLHSEHQGLVSSLLCEATVRQKSTSGKLGTEGHWV